ncbi:MAG: DUF3566 domain-containing protein [Varibaculum sp.]|nr:DUF3566 domain-containing protein [Varibaculum sp.]
MEELDDDIEIRVDTNAPRRPVIPELPEVELADTEPEIVDYQPRKVELVMSQLDPWAVMKVTFLLSVAFGIATVLSALLVWLLLNSMHVFSGIQNFVDSIDRSGAIASMVEYLELPRVLALSTVVAVANVLIITALSTIGALIYNLVARLVGGVKMTLLDI